MANFKLDLSNGKWVGVDEVHMPYSFRDRQDNVFSSAARVYKLAFIGVGSSIAYYLNALGAPYVNPPQGSRRVRVRPPARPMDRMAILFGTTDAWDVTARGDGFINHERHLIGQWGPKTVTFSPDYMERAEFAAQNRDVFTRAVGVERVHTEVTAIRRFGHVFKVYSGGRFYLAQKVVVGMGAGPHQRPRTMVVWQHVRDRVVDLDKFMRDNPRDRPALPEGARVVVNGANAGIDAVERAASLGYQVTWFIGQRAPQILPGNRLEHAPELARQAISVDYNVEIKPGGDDPIAITYTPRNGAKTTMKADLYVYALGQDPMAAGAVGDVLVTQGGVPWQEFEPLYDINQVFGEPYQTAVALQVRDSQEMQEEFEQLGLPRSTSERGIQIIGAAATSLAAVTDDRRRPRIPHNFRDQFERPLPQPATPAELRAWQQQQQLIERAEDYLRNKTVAASLESVVRYDVGSVLQHSQLVGVRGAVAAMTGFAPDYLAEGVNLSTDNRTMLRIYLAQAFPDLSERLAQQFIYRVLSSRKAQPTGFTPQATRELFRELAQEYLEEKFPTMQREIAAMLRIAPDLSQVGSTGLVSSMETALELQRSRGGQITSVRKRGKKGQVTLSLTPTRYRL